MPTTHFLLLKLSIIPTLVLNIKINNKLLILHKITWKLKRSLDNFFFKYRNQYYESKSLKSYILYE